MSKKPVGSEVSTENLTVSPALTYGEPLCAMFCYTLVDLSPETLGSVIVMLIQVNVVAHGTQINNSLLFSSFFFLLILLLLLIIIIP